MDMGIDRFRVLLGGLFCCLAVMSSPTTAEAYDWLFEPEETTQPNTSSRVPIAGIEAMTPHCHDLPIGGSKKVQYSRSVSPTRLKTSYTLTRNPDVNSGKSFTAHLHLGFKQPGGAATDPQLTKETVAALRKCLAQPNIASRLKDKNGNQLAIELHDRHLATAMTPKLATAIEISTSTQYNARSTMDNWAAGLAVNDCPTAVHELLHHLGLCDEYDECKYSPNHCPHCRSLGREDTVMNNYHRAFADDWLEVTFYPCKCDPLPVVAFKDRLRDQDSASFLRKFTPPVDRANLGAFKCLVGPTHHGAVRDTIESAQVSGTAGQCPAGFTKSTTPLTRQFSKKTFHQFRNALLVEQNNAGTPTGDDTPSLLRPVPQPRYDMAIQNVKILPTTQFALDPQHFDVIAYPNCEDRNGTYYGCAKGAYRVVASSQDCKNLALPASCTVGEK